MINLILYLINSLTSMLNSLANRIAKKYSITISNVTFHDKGKFLLYKIKNDKLQAHKDILRSIFYTLMNNKEFIEFGSKKVILVTAKINGEDFSFHHNVLISNNSTFEEYYDKVKDSIITNYEYGYPVDVIPVFLVRVWNMDEFVNKTIKITKDATRKVGWQNKVSVESKFGWNNISKRNFTNHIKPIKATNITDTITDFATMDVETINFNDKQIPIAISIAYNETESKLFLIDYILFTNEPYTAIDNLWKDYIDFITSNPELFKTIFVHNLGSFDGLFLYL